MKNEISVDADANPQIPLFWVAISLLAIGTMALVGFLVVFMNVPWEWSMFMDDTLYNAWMPRSGNVLEVVTKEITSYWELGRFYPVKYLANLLKWKYLPNDPYIFRYFNLSVFLASIGLCSLSVIRAVAPAKAQFKWAILVFLMGSAIFHKPLLEIISLNPLGETWVCFFFSLGVIFLFSPRWFCRSVLARLCFVLVALSKEPAALVFFASSVRYIFLAWKKSESRKSFLAEAAADFALFAGFLSLALYVMSQGSFTKAAYFHTTPWLRYAKDFLYKALRYGLWTSPFVAIFLFSRGALIRWVAGKDHSSVSAAIFFFVFGLSYLVFMSTQGVVAYQDVPASIGFFGLFSVLICWLFWSGHLGAILSRFAPVLMILLSLSYFISVSRWERFVRGIVEPRRAVTNLLATGEELTILVPVGEISGHIATMMREINPRARIFELGADLDQNAQNFKGKVYMFEFPFYMGDLDPALKEKSQALLGGWASVTDAKSYRVYRGQKEFH